MSYIAYIHNILLLFWQLIIAEIFPDRFYFLGVEGGYTSYKVYHSQCSYLSLFVKT